MFIAATMLYMECSQRVGTIPHVARQQVHASPLRGKPDPIGTQDSSRAANTARIVRSQRGSQHRARRSCFRPEEETAHGIEQTALRDD
jgi:hypothetical protein